MRTLGGLLAALLLQGCATTWTALELTGVDWSNTWRDSERPAGPLERRVRVSARYEAPPPPRPAPVVAQPAALPAQPPPPPPPRPARYTYAPPEPKGALALSCVPEQRYMQVHKIADRERYNFKWKVITTFFVIAEAAFAASMLFSGSHSDSERIGLDIGAAYLGADLIGTAVLFFHPVQELHFEKDEPGTWKPDGEGCPAATTVETPLGPVTAARDGELGAAGEAMLRAAIDTAAPRFGLVIDGAPAALTPSEREQCDWATAAGVGSRRPGCQWTLGKTTTEAAIALPADAPVRQ